MTDLDKAVVAAIEALSLSDYSETPKSWVNERYYFREGALAAARLLSRHFESIERHAESARAKRLELHFGVR
jgi:hypothetical protein